MDKYYIKVTGRGFLKDITKKWHNGWFSKQHSLAINFENKLDAIEFKTLAIDKTKASIKKLQSQIDGVANLIENWDSIQESVRATILNKFDYSTYYASNKERFLKNSYGGYGHARKKLGIKQKLLPKLEKSKVILDEASILFFPKKKGEIKWLDAPHSVTSPSDRIYCNGCGGVIPGAKYLSLKNESWHRVYLCPFCAGKLAEEASKMTANIEPKLADQYKKDAFMEML